MYCGLHAVKRCMKCRGQVGFGGAGGVGSVVALEKGKEGIQNS